jgi:GH25 family lysozyme M1 (1,4-beta-N-acetylmuramidase)
MSIKGIDVSKWQGSIDFEKFKAAGYEFVVIRCNNWDSSKNCVTKDPYFEQNYARAKSAGLKVGAYYYTWQSTVLGAKEDVGLCLEYIKGKQFEYPVYYDLEWQKAFSQGRDVCSTMVETFCGAMEKAGYFVGLYISRSPLQCYITAEVANRYALWIAEYGVSKPQYSGTYGMWQHTDNGSVPGVGENVDLDVSYVDYAKLITEGGFNGFPKSQKPAPAEPAKPAGSPKGDLNGDGKVDIEDVAALVNHINGVKPLE